MILLDEEDLWQTKHSQDPVTGGLTLRFPEKALGRSDSPLPDYETSEARQKLIVKEKLSFKRLDPKLWRAILYALGIYVLLSVVIGVPIVVLSKNKEQEDYKPSPISGSDNTPNTSISIMNSNPWALGDTAKCEWDQVLSNFTARATQALNYCGSFYIRSNISQTTSNSSYSKHHITVDLNPDPSSLEIVFQVEVSASSWELLHITTACFDNLGDEKGLLVYASRELNATEVIGVNIQVLFPRNEFPQYFENFTTYLPGFSHTFGDLANYTTFNNVVVEGDGYNFTSKSLKASKISIINPFGSIFGDFYVTNSLSLDGIKGDIVTNITLDYDPRNINPTSLMLDTGAGAIDAHVTLVSSVLKSPSHSQPYAFVADVRNFNGPLKIQLVHGPSTPPMPLQLSVQNNEGNTNVILDESYEGKFDAQSKPNIVSVRHPYLPPSADPLQMGRSRSFHSEKIAPNRVFGTIGWGEQALFPGEIKIISSLSPTTLQLGYGQ